MAAYQEATAIRIPPPVGASLQSLITTFERSADFDELAPRTRQDYSRLLRLIGQEFGDFPLAHLSDRRTRGIFLEWRDDLAKASKRQADYAWTVLARLVSWGLGRGLVEKNPFTLGGRLYSGTRAENVWSDEQVATFLEGAPAHLHLPFMLALWTGQRQGDVLRLPWSAYDGKKIRLRQGKTGRRVEIPVAAPLKSAINATPRKSPIMVLSSKGRPWSATGFQKMFGNASRDLQIANLTFNDLRGTAVTRLALTGCTEAEIISITGHSLAEAREILDAHYLFRDPRLAETAIRKLEKGTKTTKRFTKRPNGDPEAI
jgi:integrase